MGVIDTLTLQDPGPATLPTFVVNTAVAEVVANFPAAPATWYGMFATGNGKTEFVQADNVQILSIALVLPFCFGLGSTIPYWGLLWRDTGGGSYVVPEWGTDGYQQHYATNQEIEINQFLPWNPNIGAPLNSELAVGIMNLSISMINVPAVLNATTQDIQIVMKVLHNLDMV